jgi:Spy/CpxP family protein refolding chaperone
MRVRSMAVAGALALAGSVLAVGAQEARERRAAGTPGRPDPAALRAELGLSDEQAAQMERMGAEGRKQAIRQRADLAIARLELEELMNAPVVDQRAIDAKVKAIADLQAGQLKARTDQRLALRRLLSPEQQEKMKQLLRQRRAERGARPAGAWRDRRPGRTGVALPPPGPGGPWPEGDEDPAPPEPER